MNSTTSRGLFSIAHLCGNPLFAAIFPATAAGQCYYTWQRIPNPGSGLRCVGKAINNSGAVAGRIESIGDTTSAFVWSPEAGLVQLPMVPGYVSMEATGINDLGHVAGDMFGPAGWAGFLWDGANYTLIHHPPWASQIDVNGVNNRDQIVGTFVDGLHNNGYRPFVWESGVATDLGALLAVHYAEGAAINELGEITGHGGAGRYIDERGFLVTDGTVEWYETPAGLNDGVSVALNHNGFSGGWGKVDEPIHFEGVIWVPWGSYVIPPKGISRDALVYGVNDARRAVGFYYDLDNRPFAWQSGVLTELRPLVTPELPFLRNAWAINEHGTILAEENRGTVVLNPVWRVGDLSGDCHVSIEDLVIVLSNFGLQAETFPQGDVNGDGAVTLPDLALLLAHWGE